MSSKFGAIQTSDASALPHQMRILIAIDKSDAAQWAFEVGAKMAQENLCPGAARQRRRSRLGSCWRVRD